ncbi:MAG: hypothetical protein ACRBN8_12965 [Nannocystales bacterium]
MPSKGMAGHHVLIEHARQRTDGTHQIDPMQAQEESLGRHVAALTEARAQALAWWKQLQTRPSAPGTGSADDKLRAFLPAGPACHPSVLHAVRSSVTALVAGNEHHRDAKRRLVEHLRGVEPDLAVLVDELLLFPNERPPPNLSTQPSCAPQPPRTFRFQLLHPTGHGISRLTGASHLMPSLPTVGTNLTAMADARSEYRSLFLAYERHLEAALSIAETWWGGIIETTMAHRGVKPAHAAAFAFDEYFAGPAACPELQWTIHHYWTRCVLLNAHMDVPSRVPPESLLLTWLNDGKHVGWLEAISCLPYWPIGLDEEGRWR